MKPSELVGPANIDLGRISITPYLISIALGDLTITLYFKHIHTRDKHPMINPLEGPIILYIQDHYTFKA